MAFYATFLQDQFQVLCDLFIHIWNQARHCFKNGNLRSKCGIYGCKFYTDHTTTDDNQTLWNFFQLKKFITCQNSRKIHSRNRKNQWFGTRSQNDILCPTAPAIADAYYRLDGQRRLTLPLENTPYAKKK